MKPRQILIEAINKARANGWDGKLRTYTNIDGAVYTALGNGSPGYEEVIFNHGFAKAFWGEKWPSDIDNADVTRPRLAPWEHYLQRMVLAEDPVVYLGEFLQ